MKVLGLVFTESVSLEIWVRQGLLSREKQIYEEHLRQGHFDKVIWFTYGKNDSSIREELVKKGMLDERIQVVPMPPYFKGRHMVKLYTYLLPYIQKKYCKELCMIKTNQMGGAWTADIIHRRYGIPFILRTGYTYTTCIQNKAKDVNGRYKKWKMDRKYRNYRKVEMRLYHRCDAAFVSSVHDKEYICKSYDIPKNKVYLLTNYIDCDLFHPMPEQQRMERFIFVGRLSSEKNLLNLVEAVGQLNKGLDIYGEGELRSTLEKCVKDKGYDVRFKGVVDNKALVKVYNQYLYYILPSLFEGMPKTLLEAMACGLVCIGTDTEGINEVIQDGRTGYLIKGMSVDDIKSTINEIDARGIGHYREISDCAAEYIQKEHSLRKIVEDEWIVLEKAMRKK